MQLGDLAAYDFFKHLFLDAGVVTDGPMCHALSAFSAGLVAVCMSSPADVIKSRVMNQPFDAKGRGELYSGTLDCLRSTVREEGFAALCVCPCVAFLSELAALPAHVLIFVSSL